MTMAQWLTSVVLDLSPAIPWHIYIVCMYGNHLYITNICVVNCITVHVSAFVTEYAHVSIRSTCKCMMPTESHFLPLYAFL